MTSFLIRRACKDDTMTPRRQSNSSYKCRPLVLVQYEPQLSDVLENARLEGLGLCRCGHERFEEQIRHFHQSRHHVVILEWRGHLEPYFVVEQRQNVQPIWRVLNVSPGYLVAGMGEYQRFQHIRVRVVTRQEPTAIDSEDLLEELVDLPGQQENVDNARDYLQSSQRPNESGSRQFP